MRRPKKKGEGASPHNGATKKEKADGNISDKKNHEEDKFKVFFEKSLKYTDCKTKLHISKEDAINFPKLNPGSRKLIKVFERGTPTVIFEFVLYREPRFERGHLALLDGWKQWSEGKGLSPGDKIYFWCKRNMKPPYLVSYSKKNENKEQVDEDIAAEDEDIAAEALHLLQNVEDEAKVNKRLDCRFHIRGFQNLQLTCYCISVLQNLMSLQILREHYMNLESNDPLIGLLRELYTATGPESRDGSLKYEQYHSRILAIIRGDDEEKLKKGRQHDAHEFLTFLLNKLQEKDPNFIKETFELEFGKLVELECKHLVPAQDDKFVALGLFVPFTTKQVLWKTNSAEDDGIVDIRKMMEISTSMVSQYRTFEEIDDLELADLLHVCKKIQERIISKKKKIQERSFNRTNKKSSNNENIVDSRKGNPNIINLIHNWKETERKNDSKRKCDTCKLEFPSTNVIVSLKSAPLILVIQLMRFTMENKKIHGHVDFQETINLRELVTRDCSEPDIVYKLNGIVEHRGSDVECGHYTAFVRGGCPEQDWLYVDDEEVESSTLEEVLGSDAFLLFYRRIDENAANVEI